MHNPKFNLEIQNMIISRKETPSFLNPKSWFIRIVLFQDQFGKKIWSLNIKRIIHPSNLKSKCCKLQNPNEHLTLSNVQCAMNKVQRKKYLQVLIMEFGFQISLHSSSWPLWIPPLLNVDALQILLSFLNFDAHTPSFLLSKIKIHGF